MAIGKPNSLLESGRSTLRAGYAALALKIQEAAGDLSHNDITRRLSDAVQSAHKGTGTYAYYLDHLGDADSGDVIYSCGGAIKRAPYSVAAGGNDDGTATTYSLDTDNAEEVTPRTIYESQPDEDSHYSRMEEAFRAEKLYSDLPLYERFVSKSERDQADASDFAGKGKSFPILKPQDVSAAAHALGRAGSSNLSVESIKKNIIAIAKRKNWQKYLPKAWQDGASAAKESALSVADALKLLEYSPDQARDEGGKFTDDAGSAGAHAEKLSERAKESSKGASTKQEHRNAALDHGTAAAAHSQAAEMHADAGNTKAAAYHEKMAAGHDKAAAAHMAQARGKSKESAQPAGGLRLVESASTTDEIVLREAAGKTDYEIKLIAPGKGATAYYPAEVLKRDGPKAFGAETKVYLNHPTAVQEAEGEGNRDVMRLAGVLTAPAEWKESHVKGPGLYSRMKVFADHAATVEEKGKYLAMSILADGRQLVEAGKKVFKEGLPVLAALTHGESVDIVAKAGAGGLILQESAARSAPVKVNEAGKKEKDCPDCKGTGDCASCDGTGKVAKAAESKSKGKPKEMVDCADCKGSGDCPGCDGDGKVMEAARSATGESNMDEETIKRIVESAVTAAVAPLKTELDKAKAESLPLLKRALESEATVAATEALDGISMREAGKRYVISECLKSIPVKDGKLDTAVFKESVTAKAKELAPVIGGEGGRVFGMGAAPVAIDAKEAEAQAAQLKKVRESATDSFTRLMGGNRKAAEAAANKGVAA